MDAKNKNNNKKKNIKGKFIVPPYFLYGKK